MSSNEGGSSKVSAFSLAEESPSIPSQNEKECLEFKNNILNLLGTNGFKIDDQFIKEHIYNDRDKDLIAYKEDSDFLICCKYRQIRNIGFNDVERVSSVAKNFNSQGVIVTTTGYSKNAKSQAKHLNVILSRQSNIIEKLETHIEKESEKKEMDIIYDILN
ncbi:hypothetical protein Glove_212g182 [Diversispora epigaea]|uniref:Restriction endonuclease type IV Mrr domain-containing protein n=1 Tax=Diversispora epigaea TaxID=1348612 RepID=A0A397IRH3_9GLOM|nr:hypothetical protein Glove_212g182 [Diversispora epigaea]